MGGRGNTEKNALLRLPDGSYLPAHRLESNCPDAERNGRSACQRRGMSVLYPTLTILYLALTVFNTLKGFEDFNLRATTRTCSGLSYS